MASNKLDPIHPNSGFYVKLKKILEHGGTNVLIIIFTALNTFVIFILGNESQAKKLTNNFKWLAEFVLENGSAIVICSVLLSGLYSLLVNHVNKKCSDSEQELKELRKQHTIALVVLEKIEQVVVKKRIRFAEFAKTYANTPDVQTPKHKKIFDGITQPEQQTELLIEALRDCLIAIYPNETIKVALMKVKNSQVDDWVCHSPYDTKPRTSIKELRNVNSTFSKCIEGNKLIIIPNTQIELKKTSSSDIMYVSGQSDSSEVWCQVCAPVHSINSNEIIYIISIAIQRENVIVDSNMSYLNWLLGFFKSRLALEHSLDQLKKRISP
ncbi:hypothetical protein [Acinetobacter rudis]|uniref:hypothetical protein n=1 Tax=Acinetobacter rudis TaxID=632955 RepID=UPI00333F9F4E